MDLFDKISKKASEAYKITSNKTEKIAKETKLKMKMNNLKADIEDIYKEIGKKTYKNYTLNTITNIKEDLEQEFTEIDVLSEQIDTILNELLELKDKKQCKNCFTNIDKTYKFCPNCGAKQEEKISYEDTNYENTSDKNINGENTNDKEDLN